jgi:protein SEY1
LDLPTQQVLLAQYRCDEIAQTALETFDQSIKPLEQQVKTDSIIPDLGTQMGTARKAVLEDFETQAQRYHKDTFRRKLEEVKGIVDLRLHVLFRSQISGLHSFCIKQFNILLETPSPDSFGKKAVTVKEKVLGIFEKEATSVIIEGTNWTYDHDRELLMEEINGLINRLKKEEITNILGVLEKQVKLELEDPVSLAFAKPTPQIWDHLIKQFEGIKEDKINSFQEKAKTEVNAEEKDMEEGIQGVKIRSWNALKDKLEGECEPTHLLVRLRELYSSQYFTNVSFEDRFRYDEQGVPRIWKPSDDIDGLFKSAKDEVPTNSTKLI